MPVSQCLRLTFWLDETVPGHVFSACYSGTPVLPTDRFKVCFHGNTWLGWLLVENVFLL